MMPVSLAEEAIKDLEYWRKTDVKIIGKIIDLISEISRTPFEGTGKPEPLKFNYKGYWSRRINQEHRLIYKVANSQITIISCRDHY